MRLLILPDPANVFAPSDNAILLPLSLPEAPIGILPTTSPPARSTAEVDMSAFDEDMAASSSSLSSILKRGRNSPAKGPIVGTKVRILSLRMRAFLLFSMGVLEAFFYRGVRKMQISLPFASRSICFFGAWRWGGRRPVFRACADFLWTEPILKCFSGPFCPRSHRCCASTLPIQNARQPSWAFCCALGGWWLGRCGVAGAPVAHLEGGQGPNVGRGAVYTGIFGDTLATYAPIPAVFFFFLAPFDVRPGPGYAWPRRGSWVPTLIRGLPSRGTPAKKNRRRSEKPCRCAWPLLQQRGAAGCFFPPPP